MYSTVSRRCCQSATPPRGGKPDRGRVIPEGHVKRCRSMPRQVPFMEALAAQEEAPSGPRCRDRSVAAPDCKRPPRCRGCQQLELGRVRVSPLRAGRYRNGPV